MPADYYMNGTVHAGTRAKVSDRVRPRPPATLRNRVYLTLTVGEGDNIQYCQRRMRDLWDNPARGQVPVNWTVSPLLADIGPALLAHYQRTATANDLLISGPSGAGYTYPGSWPREALDAYTRLTGRFLRRTGMDLAYAYNQRLPEGNGWVPFDERIVRSYRDNTPLRGIIQSWETGDLQIRPAGLAVIGNYWPQGDAAEYRDGLMKHIEGWDGSGPLFIAGAVNAWNWTPSDIAELGGLLTDPFEVVRGTPSSSCWTGPPDRRSDCSIIRRASRSATSLARPGGCHHADGAGGVTTGGRSSQVMVFGSSHGASQGPVVPPPSLPPRSVSENSEPAAVKLNDPQLLTPTAPTLRASTFSKDADPAARALTTEVPVPSTLTSLKRTFVIEYRSFTGQSLTSMIAL